MTINAGSSPRGFITIVVLILLFVMVTFAAVITASVIRTDREVKLLEKQQIERLANNGKAAP